MLKNNVLRTEKLTDWQHNRFGMFIHWGLYSARNQDCWKMYETGIPVHEYAKAYEPRFTGKNFDADAIAGFRQYPPVLFTEEYQCEMLDCYHKVLDKLDFIIGEHVWNFADFATKQDFRRVVGNRKGVFTRQRQPKAVAFMLKKRWENFSKY